MTMRWPLGRTHEIVMRADHRDIAFSAGGRGESGVELSGGHLPDEIAAQIHLLDDGAGAVRLSPLEIDEEMPVGEELDGVRAMLRR